jgi:glycosyltransferase involved in cell wall biosynthesis
MTTTVAAVVPSHDNLDELKACLASLLTQTRQPTLVLVCVDGSRDGTLEHLASLPDGTMVIRALTHPANAHRGRSATRNLALGALGDGYTWFVDSDMVLNQDALERHLEVASSRACVSVGAVDYANADDAPWAAYLATRGRHRFPDGAVLPFTQFTTANSLVRSEHVRALGGFDERFVGYGGEDVDFAYRLQRSSGEPFINNRLAIARTVEQKSTSDAIAQLEGYGATNLHLLEETHPDMPPTFELQRLGSRRLVDRAFVASVNPMVGRLVDLVLPIAPRRLRNQLLNYKVVAGVWRGYRSRPTEDALRLTDE